MSTKTRPSAPCKTLNYLESSKIIKTFNLSAHFVGCLLVDLLFLIVLIAKSPIISTASLSKYSCVLVIPPLYKVIGCFVSVVNTSLNNFRLHVYKYRIWLQVVLMPTEKCFNHTLSNKWARPFHLF